MTVGRLHRAMEQEETQGPGRGHDCIGASHCEVGIGAWRVGPVTDRGPVSTCVPRTISLLELGVR